MRVASLHPYPPFPVIGEGAFNEGLKAKASSALPTTPKCVPDFDRQIDHLCNTLITSLMDDLEIMRASAASGQLIAVIGAGASIGLASDKTPSLNWPQLIKHLYGYAHEHGKIEASQFTRWLDTIDSGDIDELLGAAEFVSRKVGGRGGLLYARWLEEVFGKQNAISSGKLRDAICKLSKARIPLCTLNYDTLIERCTRQSPITLSEPRAVMEWARRESGGVLHLHGVWNDPSTVVLGISDYREATSSSFRDALQRSISTLNRLVFVGCGETLYDPNLSSLLKWLRETLGGAGLQHYALVRASEVEAKKRDALWQGLVTPISYGENYEDLPKFILEQLTASQQRSKAGARRQKPEPRVLQTYRDYLIADCGRMTIEGVRADADTAKQKFDLERLFVPLQIDPVPPEFAQNDPDREKKLKEWERRNPGQVPFGSALARIRRLALLALPGGGKTLLLKRLAVAYADPKRRTATSDALPNTDILPVLIRCREWRQYISMPIPTILSKMSEISGEFALTGFFEALQDRLKSGKVLLLVDGLDEIHSDADRVTFVANLSHFLSTFKKVRLVVTSREAGFALVAPSLMQFCDRWRIAPLSTEAISLLCGHWHQLMSGAGVNPEEESATVVNTITSNDALHRLAENPLLLTMLLVVKHGYGRLPPDRVSLYDRAIEVLLDTWNIKGHSALNPKEAVPQLAYIAYRMTQEGRQTATEQELLRLIDECRREVPMVRLYARDTASEFLKRVELRSSLLLEGGKSHDGTRLVPFYQFRHLTFQEYMTAVAIVEGHYSGFNEEEPITTPFGSAMLADEWKEVVPMAAVLAKKRASSIINALLEAAKVIETDRLKTEWPQSAWHSYRMPAPVARLTQCLVEEAEFSQTGLSEALRMVATFAHGCRSPDNWAALMRGPFGESMFDVAWALFKAEALPPQTWIRNTVALMAFYQKPERYWLSNEGMSELHLKLTSADSNEATIAAATVVGIIWDIDQQHIPGLLTLLPYLENNVIRINGVFWTHNAWAFALLLSRARGSNQDDYLVSADALNVIARNWVNRNTSRADDIAGFALVAAAPSESDRWKPDIQSYGQGQLEEVVSRALSEETELGNSNKEAAVLLAFLGGIPVDHALALATISSANYRASRHRADTEMYKYFGASDAQANRLQSRSGRIRSGSSPRPRSGQPR